MKTGQRRSALSYIPGFNNNAVIQLIIFSGVAYVILALTWAVIRIVYPDEQNFHLYFMPLVSLPALANFKTHIWTLFTYGWFVYPGKFWDLFSNMLWLYCFGSVVQFLVGYRQVIPIFVYSTFVGGVVYLLAQFIPGVAQLSGKLGQEAGGMGLAFASVALSPKYRLYLTEYFSLPLAVVAGVFVMLMVFSTGFMLPSLLLLVGGAISGVLYVQLLRSGYRPGAWMYLMAGKIEGLVTPNENITWQKTGNKRKAVLSKNTHQNNEVTQKVIDDLLDKINQYGYNSLTEEEKNILKRAGQEK